MMALPTAPKQPPVNANQPLKLMFAKQEEWAEAARC